METGFHPLLFIAFVLMIWQGYRMRAMHRHYWGIGLFSSGKLSIKRLVSGIVAGAVLSASMIWNHWDAGMTPALGWWIGGVTLLLGWVRVRMMGISYAVGIVSLLTLIGRTWDAAVIDAAGGFPAFLLQELDVAPLLLSAGVVTAIGGLFIVWMGDQSYCPVLLPRRGKSVGAFALQSLWVVPILLPLGDSWLIYPVMLAHADQAISRDKKQRARMTGLWFIGLGVTLAVIGWAGLHVNAWEWAGAVWALLGPKFLTRLSYNQENKGTPKFHMDQRGMRVLAIQEKSPAADMGIRPGDVITHANGQAIHNMTDLYAAMQQSPAFCKLEVLDENDEKRFVQRSRYAGEPHQLGILPVSETSHPGRCPDRFGLWTWLTHQTSYRRNGMDMPIT